LLALPAQALTSNTRIASAVRVTDETACTGDFEDGARPYTGLFAADNPVNNSDPSGHSTENLPGQSVNSSIMGNLAGQVGGAVARAQTRIYISYAWSIQHSVQIVFWTDVASLGASFLPEALTAAAEFGDSLNRQAARSEGGFSAGIVRGVEAEESILRPAIQNVGGKFLGGKVKGIDGELAIGPGGVLIQGKTHDVAPERLLETIGRGMQKLSTVDEEVLYGSTSRSVGGGPYRREIGPATGKIYAVLVPESQARTIVSPTFINGLRQLAERTKTIPIIRVVRGWRGAAR
jgi:hypothetical protein